MAHKPMERLFPTFSSVLNRCTRLARKAKRLELELGIHLKWPADARFLPLTNDHKDLYWIIHRLCHRELNRLPSLRNCNDFNDHIQWLKLFDQDREIIRCCDKIRLRERVAERVGKEYLATLYQVADQFSGINTSSLPSEFVIKTNHDSGTVLVFQNREMLDDEKVKQRFDEALKRPYGWNNGEWAYSYVKPKIFVEEFLNDGMGSGPPPDYKFHCVNGEIRWMQFVFDRGSHIKECIVDPDGAPMGLHLSQRMTPVNEFTKPLNWSDLCRVAEAMATGFKYVRVDLYNLSPQRIVCGELTFYPWMGCYKTEGQKILGRLMDFERKTVKPFLIPTLESESSRHSLYPQVNSGHHDKVW